MHIIPHSHERFQSFLTRKAKNTLKQRFSAFGYLILRIYWANMVDIENKYLGYYENRDGCCAAVEILVYYYRYCFNGIAKFSSLRYYFRTIHHYDR